MKIAKVLLVDDEEDIRTVGAVSLGAVGNWETVLADSGPDALKKAESEAPDVILLDVMMPEMDGPTTYRALRDNAATSNIPVIFMTAKVQKHEVERYRELGAAGVIAKPFDPMTLAQEVQRIVDSV